MSPTPIKNMLSYIHNRWVNPSDRVVIKHPDCPKGRYRDTDTIMLFAVFQLLVDFVEIECGSHWGPYRFETFGQKVYRVIQQLPLIHWFLPPGRNVRRGLHHLRWSSKLTDMPSQAQHAKDVFALYCFWKHERPRRQDPWSWAETFEDVPKRVPGGSFMDFTPEYAAYLDGAGQLEEQYNKEDDEKLHLLINVRQGLWT